MKRILRYLKGSLHHGLLLKAATPPIPIKGLCDADWASDPDDHRSTSGVAIYFGLNLISWWSKKQQIVARSSTETEYQSLAEATAEVVWIQTLLTELSVPFTTPAIFCDNQSAVAITHNPVLHSRTKHMEIDIFFVQWADTLTKALSPTRFLFLRSKLNVLKPPPKSQPH